MDPAGRRERRRVGHGSIYLQSEGLNASMLGKKARTIVMREMGGKIKPVKGLPVEELAVPKFDIQESIEADEKDFTMEIALANVDDIRPTDPIVLRSEFDGLLEVLVNGFTVAQLRAYVARETAKARTAVAEEKAPQYDWARDETPWTPFQRPEVVGSPKERLALTIMIEAWRLNIREMLDSMGSFSAKVEDKFFVLLASHLTTTFITYSTKTRILHISWFKDGTARENDAAEQLEHVVTRLLYTAFHPRDASVSLTYDPKDDAGTLVPELRGEEKLPWKHRLTQWSRYVTPAGRVSPPESTPRLKARDVLPHSLQRPVQDPDTPWSKQYTSTLASFGQILHENKNRFSLAAAAEAKNHVFSPTSPHPTGLAALSKALSTTPVQPIQTTIVLGFHLHPSLREMEDLPRHLELRLTLPEELPEGPLAWDACKKDLVAVLGQSSTDVAYPSEPVDLRLSQSLLSAMSPAALDTSPFREYTETAKLDLVAGRLRPPPEIELTDLPSIRGGGVVGGTAKYVFSGLEMRRTLNVDYEGHKLHYTGVEAGLHGGRRSELVLEAQLNDENTADGSEEAFAERYLSVAADLVKGRAFKWFGERDVAREFDAVVAEDVEAQHVPTTSEPQVAEEQSSAAVETAVNPTAAGEQEKDTISWEGR
ncbi:hypothetical protein CH35J_008617 [Colletotrichum higginsianum]|uniref:Uncharacterized protein n=1 Tax=Colletotrichum higginsianum TaxID=80884 RepID=A0A4T0VU20_9PEZI|nr:hypothetical protein CH35J_008617 [Colletotrichum higginsianum]